ncbi:MAG TPA: rhodanese-like domain-containing protein [Pedococcus sp.]|jgi:rhodanese-related sulfurtransferase|nr:rhodanese-like domain-containing protein [Pedococcus sp.]
MDVQQVSVSDVPDDAVMVDVREQDEWDAGHAPGAVHIPLSDLPSRLGDLPDDSETLAIVCRSGGRSSRAAAWLTQQGFDVANVDGGMRAWHGAGKPLVGPVSPPRVK